MPTPDLRKVEEDVENYEEEDYDDMNFTHQEAPGMSSGNYSDQAYEDEEEAAQKPFVREGKKVGRNEPCPVALGKSTKNAVE